MRPLTSRVILLIRITFMFPGNRLLKSSLVTNFIVSTLVTVGVTLSVGRSFND